MSPPVQSSLLDIVARLALSRADEKAWTALHAQLWPYLMAYSCRFLGGDIDLAEDVSQGVMIRLARYCPFEKFHSEGAFRAYIRTICRNVSKDMLLRASSRREIPLDESQLKPTEPSEVESEPDEDLLAQELLGDAYSTLNSADRKLLALIVGGSPVTEIALLTGTTKATAYVRIHRLRSKLGKWLPGQALAISREGLGVSSA